MILELEAHIASSGQGRALQRPVFFRLNSPADRGHMLELLAAVPGLQVFDELHSQLTELVRSRNPAVKFTRPELDAAATDHLGATPPEEYGVWVYYPWSARLVHLLDEHEFALVRTDRNRNKITREEQAVLATKRIGVIGLSVGQSICLTLALERGFGELRIADHDTLELSNLNRIRSGVHSMGHLKTVNVAREIAELDPFLKVTLFNEGVSRENIDRFLTEGGNLDILVDECDSVDVKIFCRQKAKALRIPVIMDTSDRGMLDVERFDLEPDRPILHGLIEHLDPELAAKAKTNEEKLPFVLPILNIDTLSKRMKASMLEIESSVTTWPQLASSVVLGGALGAEYCRRIFLGQSTKSGRWFVDLDAISGEATEVGKAAIPVAHKGPAGLTNDHMVAVAARYPVAPVRSWLAPATAETLVSAGILAPSAGNNQPWRFLLHEGRLFVFHDRSRSFSQLDGGGLIPDLGLGACIENMLLSAGAMGKAMRVIWDPIPNEDRLIAVLEPLDQRAATDPLAAFIPLRCTNRKKARTAELTAETQHALMQAVSGIEGSNAHMLTGTQDLAKLADLVGAAERIRILNPIGHQELFGQEIRWTPEQVLHTRDGLDLDTFELTRSERAAMDVAADTATMDLLRHWKAGNGFTKLSGDAIRVADGACLITGNGAAALAKDAGRAVERMWLAATQQGLSVHPISAPIFLAHHVRYGDGAGFSAAEKSEIMAIYQALTALFSLQAKEPYFLVRLGITKAPSARSLRKPIGEVFHVYEQATP
jgi:molybdopterin/thiamine biosynthesis adenylyltransferase/nitroreductase